MENNELMKILLLLNKSKKNKDAAFIFGALAVASAGAAIYCYYKNKESKEELYSMQRKNKYLFTENQRMSKILQCQQNPIKNQSIQKIDLTVKNTPPVTEENKGLYSEKIF